jgi:nitroimidazol reductase NimA-like FMN-containing flavoprotein (pyridoxamine 5'-phosphate oxidase superfamily)
MSSQKLAAARDWEPIRRATMKTTLKQEILAVLEHAVDMTIATIREDGYPQATTVSYVNDGLIIYFGTGANSQKARNLARNRKVSITINLPYTSWDDIRGVSLAGTAERVADADEIARVSQLMSKRFPQIANYASAMTGELALFGVTPQVFSLLDYRQGFGHTQSVTAAELESETAAAAA